MDLGITGKVALIMGGDGDIGRATARDLLAEGARVVISGHRQDKVDAVAQDLGAPQDRLLALAADVTDTGSLSALHERIAEKFGQIDILINASGITGAEGLFHDIDLQGWSNTVDTNLLGPVRVTQEFLPDLRSGGWGRLVFVVTEDAVQPYDDKLPYSAAKAGLLALSKGLSRSYAREGLLVNSVSPAFVQTAMTDAMMDQRAEQLGVSVDEAVESFLDTERPFMELKRRGRPEEVAAVIAFLVSDRASFVNGSNYRVDSGSVATV